MELTYKNEKLRNICENSKYNKELAKKYGAEVAKKLPRRIKELRAFNSLNDVPTNPPFRRHKLTGDRDNQFAISITNQYRLIFRQIALVRNSHRLIGRKLKKMIKSILTDEYLDVSSLNDSEYLIYENIQNGIYKIV